jgi:sigma-B regulation protein RsbU (phosphoserine phosphatase)
MYDYLELPGGRYAIVLGDVAGKGFPAALLMCAFQASLRALAELDLPPQESMVRLNRILCRRLPANRFVTFFYADLDPASHRLCYVNAGHCPPWLIRPGKSAPERLPGTGRPLGLLDNSSYESNAIELEPGEIVVCFSDGVPDAAGPSGEDFGETRLIEIVQSAKTRPPAEIVRRVMEAIDAHHEGVAKQDDITLVVLKRAA